GADGVEGDVAEQLDPDLVTDARRDGTAESGVGQRLRDLPAALRLRTVRLADTQAVSIGVMDHTRLSDVGGQVRERSDHAPRLDRRRDDATGIDALEPQAVQLAADALEVPPRNAVLRAHDDGVGAEQGAERGSEGRQAVRLDAEDDDVRLTDGVQVARD